LFGLHSILRAAVVFVFVAEGGLLPGGRPAGQVSSTEERGLCEY
jgi:hypothetical protein